MDFILLLFLMAIGFVGALYSFSKSKSVSEFKAQIFVDKDLPIAKQKKIGTAIKFDIKYYDLKKTKKGDIDRTNLWYLKIAQIVNKNMVFTVNENMELDVELNDLKLPEYADDYNDIVEIVTNFKYRQFAFKSDSKFNTLLDVKSSVMDELKEHADKIIHEVFVDVAENVEEMLIKQYGESVE